MFVSTRTGNSTTLSRVGCNVDFVSKGVEVGFECGVTQYTERNRCISANYYVVSICPVHKVITCVSCGVQRQFCLIFISIATHKTFTSYRTSLSWVGGGIDFEISWIEVGDYGSGFCYGE